MSEWVVFWKAVCILGLAAFYLLVVATIPIGLRDLIRLFRLQRLRWSRPVAACLFIGIVGAYGVWAEMLDTSITGLWALTLVVSIMHFWYDGFIWSVSRRHVTS